MYCGAAEHRDMVARPSVSNASFTKHMAYFSASGRQSSNPTDDSGMVVETTGAAGAAVTSTGAPVTGSNFAAVNWGTDFMVFYQDSAKNIRMVESNLTIEPENLKYEWSRSRLLPFAARSSSSIAAINWVGARNRREVQNPPL